MPKVNYNSAKYFDLENPEVSAKAAKRKEFQTVLQKARKNNADHQALKALMLQKLEERRTKNNL